jgi:hypothetical protein
MTDDHAHHDLHSGARRSKATVVHLALKLLEEGRAKMIERELTKGRDLLSNAKQQTVEAMRPSQRWYDMSAPFAISSNRATVLDQQENWTPLRIDTRFTLLAAPDHVRSYQRLSRIAEAYNVDMSAYLLPLSREVASKKKSMAQWRKLANRAIALMSLAAIIHARRGSLTPEKLEELEHVGIEDMYTPVNVGANIMPMLPWLTLADIEEL